MDISILSLKNLITFLINKKMTLIFFPSAKSVYCSLASSQTKKLFCKTQGCQLELKKNPLKTPDFSKKIP
jgi:hypothetical protein